MEQREQKPITLSCLRTFHRLPMKILTQIQNGESGMLVLQEREKNSTLLNHEQVLTLTYPEFKDNYLQSYGIIFRDGINEWLDVYGEDLKILQYILRKQFKLTYYSLSVTTNQSRQTCMNHYYAVLRSKALRHEADTRWREVSARYFSKNK